MEGARRGPSRITHVEDALLELLRNARDAGATRIYVASTLRERRYRTLTVLDNGHGIPASYRDLIFEPGVTTRHLHPVPDDPRRTPHGAGLSLYQIQTLSLSARVLSVASPTSIQATFDTRSLPERALQSTSRPSRTNLRTTLETFTQHTNAPDRTSRLTSYYGTPARILATLLHHRIIPRDEESTGVRERAEGVGLGVSLRSVQRIIRGEVEPARSMGEENAGLRRVEHRSRAALSGGVVLAVGEEETEQIAAILRRAARAAYLEVADLSIESRPGEVSLRARVYEPEEEYE